MSFTNFLVFEGGVETFAFFFPFVFPKCQVGNSREASTYQWLLEYIFEIDTVAERAMTLLVFPSAFTMQPTLMRSSFPGIHWGFIFHSTRQKNTRHTCGTQCTYIYMLRTFTFTWDDSVSKILKACCSGSCWKGWKYMFSNDWTTSSEWTDARQHSGELFSVESTLGNISSSCSQSSATFGNV